MPEHLTTVYPHSSLSVPPDPAWDEAFLRVESYLRAHHLESRVLLNQFATEIIVEARGREPAPRGGEAVACAMAVTYARIEAWFARVAKAGNSANERDRSHGRLALVIANLPGHWSNFFLSEETVPSELAAAMASFQFQPGPELRFSNMPTAPLEFGFEETGDPRAAMQGIWPLVRAASSSLLVAGLVGAAWAVSH